jgi:hypothetical protein
VNLDVLVQQMSPSQRAELADDLASLPGHYDRASHYAAKRSNELGVGAPHMPAIQPRTKRFLQAVVDQLREFG